MFLTDNRLIHPSRDKIYKVFLSGDKVVEFSDVYWLAHSLSSEVSYVCGKLKFVQIDETEYKIINNNNYCVKKVC